MKTLLILLLSLLPLAAQQQVQVRVVSIEKPGAATSLEAAQPDCDEKLYAALIADAASGKAKIVHDQTVIVRSGQRSKTAAVREFPCVDAGFLDPESCVMLAQDFTYRLLGQLLEVEAIAGYDPVAGLTQRPLDINLAPEHTTLLAMQPWPVPDFRGAGQMGRVLKPVIATHKLQTEILTWTGRTVLLSVAASPGAAFQESAEIPFRYTFLRAGLDGEKPAPANARAEGGEPVRQVHLHAVTFRLPREEAAALLLQGLGDDAALYDRLSAAAKSGTATLSAHTAILVRHGEGSQVASNADFSLPKSGGDKFGVWNYALRPGEDLETEYAEPYCDLALQSHEAPELVPYHPAAAHPSLHYAAGEYVERKMALRVTFPASGVVCTTVLSTSPATDEEAAPGGVTDVTFLLRSPRSGPPAEDMAASTILHAAMLSVPAPEGPSLASGSSHGSTAAAAALLQRLSAGEIHCAAHAAAPMHRGKVGCVRYVQQPAEFQPANTAPEVNLPEEWSLQPCGLSLEAEITGEGKDQVFNLALVWDTAPVLPFGAPGAANPEISGRRCVQKIQLQDLHLTLGQPVIADVRASNARPGTPEHGRWHVLVLLAR